MGSLCLILRPCLQTCQVQFFQEQVLSLGLGESGLLLGFLGREEVSYLRDLISGYHSSNRYALLDLKLVPSIVPQHHGDSVTTICQGSVTSVAFEGKDDPTQMTKIVIYNYILYYIQKTIHSKLICTNVHS